MIHSLMDFRRIESPCLLDYAYKNRNENFFNDVLIVTDSESIPSNRMVLSCYSPVFERMFKTEMKEKYELSIEVKGVNGKALSTLIDYIYTQNITLNKNNVLNLLSVADYLQMDEVKKYCFEFLMANLELSNCFDILNVANLYRNVAVTKQVWQFISENFCDLSNNDHFKSLSKENLCSIIKGLDRDGPVKDKDIYESVIMWTRHELDLRKSDFAELFQLINLNDMPKEFLQNVLAKEELINEHVSCSKELINHLFTLLNLKHQHENNLAIVSFGGLNSKRKIVEVYNIHGKPPTKYSPLPVDFEHHSSLRLHDKIYCVGGYRDGATNEVWQGVFHKCDLKWKQVAPMNAKRCVMGATVFKDKLVVAGGLNREVSEHLATVEAFDPQLDKWKTISSMKQMRWGNALVASNLCLYSLGGCGAHSYLSSMEKIRSLKGKWINVKSMQVSRCQLAAVICFGKIYAIGGKCYDYKPLASVEKYDPTFDQWTFVSPMNIARCAHAACILHGKIYVIGGIDALRHPVTEIECYDPHKDQWFIVGRTDENLIRHTLVTL